MAILAEMPFRMIAGTIGLVQQQIKILDVVDQPPAPEEPPPS